jgi:hypothetical protein
MDMQGTVWPICKVILGFINKVVMFDQTVAVLSFHSSISVMTFFNNRHISILKKNSRPIHTFLNTVHILQK